uniref:Uncharacterized protein n=1 Tax=Palpitomonas bilix TaxID=652834 RepID=A0A7S3D9X9_9EUKA
MEPPVYSIPPLEFAPAVPKPQEESSAEASKEGGGGGDVGSATASVVDVQQDRKYDLGEEEERARVLVCLIWCGHGAPCILHPSARVCACCAEATGGEQC